MRPVAEFFRIGAYSGAGHQAIASWPEMRCWMAWEAWQGDELAVLEYADGEALDERFGGLRPECEDVALLVQ
jgi:hypothetical protein